MSCEGGQRSAYNIFSTLERLRRLPRVFAKCLRNEIGLLEFTVLVKDRFGLQVDLLFSSVFLSSPNDVATSIAFCSITM